MARRARILGAVVLAALMTGCAGSIDGTALRQQPSGPQTRLAGLQAVLPTPEQVHQAVGDRLLPTGPALVGSIELLPNGIRDDSQVAPLECLGPATPLMKVVYGAADVTAVALRDFARFGEGLTVSSAHTGVVRFGSEADAARVFEAFTAQWEACDGTPVIVRITPSAELRWTVTDVELRGGVLSATILSGENGQDPVFVTERAAGVVGGCIVDVDVAITDVVGSQWEPTGRAADLVRLMVENAGGGC